MIFRVMALTLLFSINAYAKPNHHLATSQDQKAQAKDTVKYSEDDLSGQLTSHSWQITKVAKESEFNFDEHQWIFNFASNGKYKGFGNCNYLGGAYKTDHAGAFRISNLDGTNNHCEKAKGEEALIFNMLLMADSLSIDGETLLLKSNGQALIELKASDKEVKQNQTQKSHLERNVDSKKSIKSQKTKAKQSKSEKTTTSSNLKPLEKRPHKPHTKSKHGQPKDVNQAGSFK